MNWGVSTTSLSLSFESGPGGNLKAALCGWGWGWLRRGQLCSALLCFGVFCRWFLYVVFVFLLGAICTREALRYDFLIAEKVGESCTSPGAPCAGSFVCSHQQMAGCPLQSCLGIHILLAPDRRVGKGTGSSYGTLETGNHTCKDMCTQLTKWRKNIRTKTESVYLKSPALPTLYFGQ